MKIVKTRIPIKVLDFEVAWAAGFFDGEGSVQRRSRGAKRGTTCLQAQVSQSLPYGREVLLRFQNAVGVGNVTGPYGPYRGSRKPYYLWSATGADCIQAVKIIVPFLSVAKKESVFNALPELVA